MADNLGDTNTVPPSPPIVQAVPQNQQSSIEIVQSDPKRKKWVWVILFIFLFILISVPCYFVYDYFSDIRAVRSTDKFIYASMLCKDYCEPSNLSENYEYTCYAACVKENTKNLHEEIGDYNMDFRKKHSISKQGGYNPCIKEELANSPNTRECYKAQIDLHEPHFKNFDFIETGK